MRNVLSVEIATKCLVKDNYFAMIFFKFVILKSQK